MTLKWRNLLSMEAFSNNRDCQCVIFSDRAYNAIIRETIEWNPVETGGILLGHILENGYWIVMEVLPPGYDEKSEGNRVIHEYAYFEYNQRFVNYLAKSVAEQYEKPLQLLGLWHRHPGSMDHFSGTDDGTNLKFALLSFHGAISGLINNDPKLRMTMYYLSHTDAKSRALKYCEVDVEVGSDLIPEECFKLRYVNSCEVIISPDAIGGNGGKEGNDTSKPKKKKSIVETLLGVIKRHKALLVSLISLIIAFAIALQEFKFVNSDGVKKLMQRVPFKCELNINKANEKVIKEAVKQKASPKPKPDKKESKKTEDIQTKSAKDKGTKAEKKRAKKLQSETVTEENKKFTENGEPETEIETETETETGVKETKNMQEV